VRIGGCFSLTLYEDRSMNDRLMTTREVADFFHNTPRSIFNWEKSGRLPPPLRLPNGRKAWKETVIRSLVETPEAA
jgi:predicted DNA-binding transcriptional regulator AlpA